MHEYHFIWGLHPKVNLDVSVKNFSTKKETPIYCLEYMMSLMNDTQIECYSFDPIKET